MLRPAISWAWLIVGLIALVWVYQTSAFMAGVLLLTIGIGGLAGMAGAYFLVEHIEFEEEG